MDGQLAIGGRPARRDADRRGSLEPAEVRADKIGRLAVRGRDDLAITGQPLPRGEVVGEDVEEHVTVEEATTEPLESPHRRHIPLVDGLPRIEQDRFGVGTGWRGRGRHLRGGSRSSGPARGGPRVG